ncbi:MAG: acetyl-CoA hydrolase/transferase family protein [Myxococcales bacterium]|nr:acetyl-CoA hydrolase/transferase family protein [Myxococcales bacterium]MCB9731724.1 acetyl-CoA hydrolase/transferase family protein [Deltaproteobacteria bacterium]
MTLDPAWRDRAESPDDLVRRVKSGDRVFLHGACATPTPLIDALARRGDLTDVSLYHLHLAGPLAVTEPEHEGRFRAISLFTGANMRKPVLEGRADFVPVFLSDIPGLFTNRRIPLDVAVIQLSPPDKHGYCTLGPSVDTALAATCSATIVLAEINEQMPRTHGPSAVHISKVTAFTLTNRPLHEHEPAVLTDVETRIGEIIAGLVPNGATLQMGIGGIPDAVLARLHDHQDLGIHTEMFSDGLIDLVHAGAVTNARKKVHARRIVTSFVSGSRRLFDFVDDNPIIEFHPCDRTNDTALIRKNPRVVAINSAIEVDLSGQVCADSIGHRIFSGIGGQMDFIRGAALSEGGFPIIALPSTAAGGKVSRITAELKSGAGVVTTRGHVHWVVTEFGAVDLHGKTLRERAEALISIAHPDFRADLKKDLARIRNYV